VPARIAQYIIRNPLSEQKMVYNAENGTVIYRSRMHAKTKRNFEIFSAEEFIAAITQHIPDNRSAQNGCRMGVNCRQPAGVVRPGPHHTPAGRILDPGAGILVWFSQKSEPSRGPAALLAGSSGKQTLIGWPLRL